MPQNISSRSKVQQALQKKIKRSWCSWPIAYSLWYRFLPRKMNETTLDCNAPRAFCLTLLADEACRKAVPIESAKASQNMQAFVQFMSGRPNDLQVLQRKVQNASPALVPSRYMQDTCAGSDLTPTLQAGLQNQGVYHCEHCTFHQCRHIPVAYQKSMPS